jgi:predicted DNA-binding transcriptional regulator YafY
MSRSVRLLAILQALRERKAPATARELAAALEVSERTVFRDIATLNTMGAQIVGEAGLGYIIKPGMFLPPLMFTEEEVEAVQLGLRYVDQRGDKVLRSASRSALAKLDTVLSKAARAVREAPISLPGPDGRLPHPSHGLSDLRAAIKRQRKVVIAYGDTEGRATERTIWPFAIAFLEDARIVAAWCELRNDFRMFRLDRIAAMDVTDSTYPERRSLLLKQFRARISGPTRS